MQYFDNVSHVEVVRHLFDAVDSTDGLDLALYLLDYRLSEQTRDCAALEFEELAVYPEIVELIERVLLAAPFPDSADLGGGVAACGRVAATATKALLVNWQSMQTDFRSV